ncbi:MAG: hypothetical protein ACLT8E_00110 [Akkermansia sp.]
MRHRTTDTAKGHRNYIIIACDVLLSLAMLKWLPVEPEVARGWPFSPSSAFCG